MHRSTRSGRPAAIARARRARLHRPADQQVHATEIVFRLGAAYPTIPRPPTRARGGRQVHGRRQRRSVHRGREECR